MKFGYNPPLLKYILLIDIYHFYQYSFLKKKREKTDKEMIYSKEDELTNDYNCIRNLLTSLLNINVFVSRDLLRT